MEAARTLPEDPPATATGARDEALLGLVIAWCAEEPSRVGEVALFPSRPSGVRRVLGRGERSADDPHPRLAFARVRGADHDPQPGLASPRISRVQLLLEARPAAIDVKSVGRLPMAVNGRVVDAATVAPGDVLELGAQLVLLVVQRAAGGAACDPRFPFGQADEHGIVGESATAWELRRAIAFAGPCAAHVLVTGASGAGKELAARALHALSARALRPMVARNAATIPETLIDAELFGNAKSYPNPGMPERAGMIGDADGTTLFLDEIGELPVAMQAHLLRVLDAGEYVRLGESRTRHSDFRLIGATNRAVESLKHDLLARFVLRVAVPGLNERREDIPLLFWHLVRRIFEREPRLARRFGAEAAGVVGVRVAPRMIRVIVQRSYETHARELEGIVWRAIAASSDGALDLAPEDRGAAPANASPDAASPLSREGIQAALDANNGVVESTWRALGLSSRHALARLIKRHDIEVRRRPR